MLTGRRRLLLFIVAVLPLSGLCAAPAQAEPVVAPASASAPSSSGSATGMVDEAKAKLAYQKGAQLYQSKQYVEAVAAFRDGYALKPHPAFLFNLAMCYRAMNEPAKAIENYEAYLKAMPDASDRAAVEAAIVEQKRKLAAAPAPPSGAKDTEKAVGKDTAGGVALAKTGDSGAAGASGERQPVYRKWWFWTATGVAVAALGVGLGVGLSSPETAPYREVMWR